MTWYASGNFIFGALAAFLQVVLGIALLLRSPRNARMTTVATLFIVNGVISGLWAFLTGVPELFDGIQQNHTRVADTIIKVAGNLDLSTNLFILMFALIYPTAGRFRFLERGWPLWLLGALLLPFVLSIWTPDTINELRANYSHVDLRLFLIGFVPFELTFMVLLTRWTTVWNQDHPPVLREQFALVFAAFGLRATHLLVFIPSILPFKLDNGFEMTTPALVAWSAMLVAMLVTLVVNIVRIWPRAEQGPWLRRRTLFVLVFLWIGVAEGLLNASLAATDSFHWWGTLSGRLDVIIVRPILIWFAIARTQFLDVRWRSDQAGAIIAGIFTGGGAMAGVFDAVSPNAGTTAAWLISGFVGAVALIAAALVTLAVLRGDDHSALPATDLTTYAVAVDEAYRHGEPQSWERARLARMRKTMAITDAQHEALVAGVTTFRASPDWRPGAVILGRYELEDHLGGGGQAQTWKARDLLDGIPVVLKLAHAGVDRAILEREQATLRRMNHPHILRPLRMERLHGAPLLVLPWCAQGTVHDHRLGPDAVRALARHMAAALSAAHAQGIVHGDVKPSNILVDGDRFVLADFGSAVHRPKGMGWSQATLPAAGTPRFAAPEVLEGHHPTPQSDLYSLGLVLLATLDAHPVPAEVPSHLVTARVRSSKPEIPDGIDAGLRGFLERCLAADPGDRPALAAALVDAVS